MRIERSRRRQKKLFERRVGNRAWKIYHDVLTTKKRYTSKKVSENRRKDEI